MNKNQEIYNKLKPFLYPGSIILSSENNLFKNSIIPSNIKHCSIYLDNNTIFEFIEHGFRIIDLNSLIKNKKILIIVHYKDKIIMKETLKYVKNYKNLKYGFFYKKETYCFEFLKNLYSNVTDEKITPSIKFFKDFYTSKSFMIYPFEIKCVLFSNVLINF